MTAPSRFPNGVTNSSRTSAMNMLGMLDPTKYNVFFEDFHLSIVGWTETAISAGAGTSALAEIDGDGGIGRITTAANEDDGLAIEAPFETFLLETGKKTFIKTRFKVGDAIQSDLIVGLHTSDSTPLDATHRFAFISEDGAAAVFFNVDDNTTDSDSGTVATLEDDTWIVLAAYYDGKTTVELYADDVHITSMTSVDLPGAEVAVGFGYWNGAVGAETTDIDYIFVAKER